MSDINECCGTCGHWQPEEREKAGSMTLRTKDPLCTFFKVIKYAEDKPVSWCWKEAARPLG